DLERMPHGAWRQCCRACSRTCSIDGMSHVASRIQRVPGLSRFGWLMALYAENHDLLQRLFEPADLGPGSHVSRIGDGLDVRLDVLERHAYTSELRLSYGLSDPVTGQPDP